MKKITNQRVGHLMDSPKKIFKNQSQNQIQNSHTILSYIRIKAIVITKIFIKIVLFFNKIGK